MSEKPSPDSSDNEDFEDPQFEEPHMIPEQEQAPEPPTPPATVPPHVSAGRDETSSDDGPDTQTPGHPRPIGAEPEGPPAPGSADFVKGEGDVMAEALSGDKTAQYEQELAAAKDQTLRALAELENTRRRAQKEREEAGAYAMAKFAREMISVGDNLRRALDATPQERDELDEDWKNFVIGIEATERELLKVFLQNGIERIAPESGKFDPNLHEVMFEAAVPDQPNGTIIQLIEPGFRLKGRLLRPARVGVAKNPNEPPPNEDGHLVDEEA